ncbi:hypothetical protein OFR22_07050 [Brachyspira hyodysenteriae]|uniref:Lipoprotein n=2 Tax=Brachyspira hyodysenteriae TaxID=159 RepID=A0A3B6VBQ9_BRAHW|nr:hypothetical protein [Brachyspira hyodysenteriae]ACN84077.1 hypothetical protein BHWA1_01607 [Brachyspira hyodysenteriae WA1]ANN63815.1 hypothetical protein BHYOB78_08030 [Brachyspira hyodysenteriae ATCC 27164]AUJ49809.1 zinc ribbon domain-containing protein [Brachyspira hyodysenteriae]KLI16578.1 hypothetical protein SU45_06765 [Brachyspira hyodysenteriae]KLI19403.1 hypothetical protein SU44_00135 [Brachyspira hyodysenteriae]
MYKIYYASVIIILFIISCNDKKLESKQYRLNIAETNEVINIKSRNFDGISLIKNSSFTAYPNITINELLSPFSSVEWQDFISEDDYNRYIDIVARYDTNEYIIQFQVTDQYRWELYAFEINKTPYTIDIVANELYKLYTNK